MDGNIIEENIIAHTPALGCCGLITTNSNVLCTKSESTKNKSKYVIHNIIDKDNYIIGVNPMLANPIVKSLLLGNKIEEFQNITELKSEITVDDSRFDFTFVNQNGQKVYLEVKNVPLVHIETEPISNEMKKIAIFPDGYRKNKNEPISIRALKHVNHLSSIHKDNPNIICALLFLIQRHDVVSFKPSSIDKIYQKALYEAHENGVKIIPLCVEWIDNKCYFLKKINLI